MTADLEDLDRQAADLEAQATAARSALRDSIAVGSQRRAERELAWHRRYIETVDRKALGQRVSDARAAVIAAIETSPLGDALLELAVAQRIEYSEHVAAATSANIAGIGAPLPGAATYDDPVALLANEIVRLADQRRRDHEAARHVAFEEHSSDHGRITAAAANVQPIICGACSRPVPPDNVYRSAFGVEFHNDPACKPRRLHEQREIDAAREAEQRAIRRRQEFG